MSCTIGDEVIYLNDEYEDGATPEVLNAPKSRFDFTHIIKTRPKAPKRRGADQSIYGEYNEHQLGINLDPLDEAYLVRITDDKSGKVVYEKAINAGNIVALNIDISANPKGHYTITVENSLESFTGEFDTIVTGIVEVRNKKIEVRDVIYNLQGQRISYLQKGLNIVNGRKVMVKWTGFTNNNFGLAIGSWGRFSWSISTLQITTSGPHSLRARSDFTNLNQSR